MTDLDRSPPSPSHKGLAALAESSLTPLPASPVFKELTRKMAPPADLSPKPQKGGKLSPKMTTRRVSQELCALLDQERVQLHQDIDGLDAKHNDADAAEEAGRITPTVLQRKYLLHVQVVEGRGLFAPDASDLSDPYCKMHVGKVKHRTKTVVHDSQPIWDQTFTFPIMNLFDDDFVLTCWDRDKYSRDTFLGTVRV